MLVMLIRMQLSLNAGYTEADADLGIRIMIFYGMSTFSIGY